MDNLMFIIVMLCLVLAIGASFIVLSLHAEQHRTIVSEYDGNHEDLYSGRLHIPDLGIDVALYYRGNQHTVDREDSASIFRCDGGFVIADHNYQAFANLPSVRVGMRGYIEHEALGKIDIVCVDVFRGYNNGSHIADESGKSVMGMADYMMYTCAGDDNEVLICLWNVIS
jgi:hypothetical protein